MLIRRHRGAAVASVLGTVIIAAHLVLAVGFGLAASQWVSGAVIGAVLVLAAGLHVIIARRRRPDLDDDRPAGTAG